MPYGNKARYTRAFVYGCLAPIEGEQRAIDQMRRRVHLWNKLVELDRRYEPHREPIKAKIAKHVTAESEKERRKQYKAAFKIPEIAEAIKILSAEEYEAARPLWRNAGLYWCNHEEVKLTWLQARRKTDWHEKDSLNFHSWRRERGKVTVRFQTGLSVKEAFAGKDRRLRLRPVLPDAYESPIRSVRRKAARSVVRLRVGSEGRDPIWLTLPCVLHRSLPEKGLIRSASVFRERIATHYRWKLLLIVEIPEPEIVTEDRPLVGIDLGWRRKEDGLRVCYWYDDEGREGELCLDEKFIGGMAQVEDLRSIRDRRFNDMKEKLNAWLSDEPVPPWIKEATATLLLWRSPARLARLILDWREARFDGDDEIYDVLEAWRQKDKHLYEWQENLRDKLLRRRREEYRIFAAEIARTYGRVQLEDFDLSRVAKVKDDGQGKELPKEARHYRQIAAVSTLRLAIENACEREGVSTQRGNAAYTTQTCQNCGYTYAFDAARELVTTCPACRERIDQDLRAAMNLVSQIEAI